MDEEAKDIVPDAETMQHSQTIDVLNKDPRKMLRFVGDSLTNLKYWFVLCDNNKYAEALCADIKSLIGGYTKSFKKMETFELEFKKNSGVMPADETLAMARMLDGLKDKYSGIEQWSNKILSLGKTKGKSV